MIVTPEVRLIAHTTIPAEMEWLGENEDGTQTARMVEATDFLMEHDEDAGDMDHLAEFAGRACYRAERKPNPATAANVDYLANIIRQQHTSVLEHASASFYITGVSRALLTELTRHRHLSFSVQSQRFVDESNANIVLPPAIRHHKRDDIEFDWDYRNDEPREGSAADVLEHVSLETSGVYRVLVEALTESGLPRKQAREAARAVLPNMTEVRMVVTGNLRAWRDVLARRLAPGADAEMREVCQLICAELETIAPNSLQGIRDHAAA